MGEPTLLTNMLQTYWKEGCWIVGCIPRLNHVVFINLILHKFDTAQRRIKKSIIGTKIFLKAFMSKVFTYVPPHIMDAVPREGEEEIFVNMATLESFWLAGLAANFLRNSTHRVFSSWEKPTHGLMLHCLLKYTILRVLTIYSWKFCQICFGEMVRKKKKKEKERQFWCCHENELWCCYIFLSWSESIGNIKIGNTRIRGPWCMLSPSKSEYLEWAQTS